MNLCLDTNVLIELLRRRGHQYRKRMAEAAQAGAVFHLSAIVLHELIVGARRSARPDHHLAMIGETTADMTLHDWSVEDAREAARVRAELGWNNIGSLDALLAGQARHRSWTVVTANVREFTRVTGLAVIDWSNPPDRA